MSQSGVAPEFIHARPGVRFSAHWLGAAMGAWISLYPFADLALRQRTSALIADAGGVGQPSPLLSAVQLAIVIIGVIPILAGVVAFNVDFRRARYIVLAAFLLILSIPLSFLSLSDFSCINYVIIIYYVFGCSVILASINIDSKVLVRSFFTAVAITLSIAMTALLLDHDYSWGRLMGRTAPNYWGALAMTTILATIVMRGWILRGAFIGLSLFVIFSTQSRAAMMSLAVSLCITVILFTRNPRAHRWSWVWFIAALGVVAAVGLGSDYIADQVLRLSDPRRGLESGLTGRTDLWREAWNLFVEHPWFGVGYRQHEQYMPSLVATHNAYLASLADTGAVGFLGYVIFLVGALCRSLVLAWNSPTANNLAVAAFLSSFAVISFVEPTGLHTGNTLAMLMIFVATLAWRADVTRT